MARHATRLDLSHLESYRALMLEAYAVEPDAFTSTVAEREALPRSWWEARLDARPDATAVALGVLEGELLIGAVAVVFETSAKTGHKASLVGMYVRKQFRNCGVGSALVGAALDAARAHAGTLVVQLTVSSHNASAKRLYDRHGFIEFGVEPYAVSHDSGFVSKCHMYCRVR
jgi:ribosomal protein S18 acetylase RimI-like enzyme